MVQASNCRFDLQKIISYSYLNPEINLKLLFCEKDSKEEYKKDSSQILKWTNLA